MILANVVYTGARAKTTFRGRGILIWRQPDLNDDRSAFSKPANLDDDIHYRPNAGSVFTQFSKLKIAIIAKPRAWYFGYSFDH